MGYRTKNAITLVSDLRALHIAEEQAGGFTFITVTADYDLANGLDPVGAVSFIPSEPMVNGETVVSAAVTRALNIDGVLLIELAANTDPATTTLSGDQAFYLVEESISGATRRFAVTIPHDAGAVVNLSELTHTPVSGVTLPQPRITSAFPKVTYPVSGPPGPPGPPGPAGPAGAVGIGTFGTTAGTAAEGNDSRITGAAQRSANLSDLASISSARANLGLGTAATRDVGGVAGAVAAGDDPRITGAVSRALVTTKGDLLVGTGSGVVARLAAGANGQVLVADSSTSTGWRFTALPSGGSSGREPLNVMAFGAVGDGFTDDRAAIQAAINSAGAQGSVFIPPGVFVIGGALTVANSGVTIMGAGYRATWLYLQNGSNSSMIATADDGVQRQGLLVSNLALIGNAVNQTGTSPAISIRGMDEAVLEQLYILEPRGEAIRTGQLTGGMTCTVPIIHECVIRGHVTASQTDAIGLNTGSSDAIVSNCDIGFFTNGAGVLLSDHAGASLTNNNAWQCRFGYWNFSAHRTRYVNCLSDYAKEHGFRVDTSNDLQYTNCQARESSMTTANTYDGFYFAGANDLSLSNCRAMGSQARVGVALASNVVRARIIGGNATGNQVAAHVIGSGCSDYRFRDVVAIPDGGSVVTLTDGATVNLDASAGKVFSLTAAGNRTIAAPTGAAFDGQEIVIAHTASGGSRTLSLATGSSGAFAFGTTITALSATTSGTTDYIACTYSTAASRWRVTGYTKGF